MELKELPNEIIVKIFHHLSIEDLGSEILFRIDGKFGFDTSFLEASTSTPTAQVMNEMVQQKHARTLRSTYFFVHVYLHLTILCPGVFQENVVNIDIDYKNTVIEKQGQGICTVSFILYL